ncbi:MAG: DNA-3-methyladenine glycosylase I [Cyanobacteria bacterium]|nr:DNA-3-methyladenine glycosylase I [Cyanobacteriota bacterium]
MLERCEWAKNPLSIAYHDTEWGVPLHDDRGLFEFLILEGAQAGLSWDTVLKKRDCYRKVFDGFDPVLVARYDSDKINDLLSEPGIIRNRLKINSAIQNARAFLKVQEEFGTFDAYLWSFMSPGPGLKPVPLVNHWRDLSQLPAKTTLSDALSKDLKKRGFNFVGSTICYAMMQAVGMVNDHLTGCFRHAELKLHFSGLRSK